MLNELKLKYNKEVQTAKNDLINFKKDMGDKTPTINDEELINIVLDYIPEQELEFNF